MEYYHYRSIVRYLRANDLWEEAPFNKKKYLLYTQLHDKEDVDIDEVITLLENKYSCSRYDWVVYILIEWYNIPKERLEHISKLL